MSDNRPAFQADVWSEWLLHRRHGDDPGSAAVVRAAVEGYADRVLDGAQLLPGMTMVDVGAGEGLLTFRAIDRIGPSLRAVLTDISAAMLHHAKTVAEQGGLRGQCAFLECPADRLDAIADDSVDIVVTRSVLAYVSEKSAALREFYRVLKPGGRISIAEPIMQDEALAVQALRMQIESQRPPPAGSTPAGSIPTDRFLVLLHRWKAAQFPDTEDQREKSPIVNYSERDLLRFVYGCGFAEIHLELHIDVLPCPAVTWEAFLDTSPHPWAPTLRHILVELFTPEERQFFEQTLRPTVEAGANTSTDRLAYLTARKPLAGAA